MTTRRSAILIATALAVPAASLSAQQLAAHVAVYGGHVSGHVVIASSGYRPIYEPRPHPAAPRVVVLTPAPRVVVVQRVGWGRGHWRRHGYREVVVYYDAAQNRYFTGLKDCRGFKQVVVYERDGRYYLPA